MINVNSHRQRQFLNGNEQRRNVSDTKMMHGIAIGRDTWALGLKQLIHCLRFARKITHYLYIML